MKVLRLGVGASLIVGMVLLSSALFFERSKETKGSNTVVGVTNKGSYETPQIIHSGDGLDDGANDTPKIMITGTTDIPLYPDARQVRPGEGGYYNKPGGGDYSFWSDSSVDKVVSFYKRELAKSGWTVEVDERSSPPTAPMATVDFGWINPVKEVPFRRHLVLDINGWVTGCEVWLRFERWPDPEYVPLYPGAQQVQVEWVNDKYPEYPDVDYFERVTTYETKTTVSGIEAYYKDAMMQHGWQMGRSEPPNHLFFSYRHDLPCPPHGASEMRCGTGSLIDIFIYPQESGNTNVEIRAGGNEIQASHKGK